MVPLNVLVTGGAGYIGGTVAMLLQDAGHHVVVYDNLIHSQRSAVPAGPLFVEGDVRDQTKLEATLQGQKIEAIFYCFRAGLKNEKADHQELTRRFSCLL